MSSKAKLKRALTAIEDARVRLRRARNETDNDVQIRRAMAELDNAESEIKRAIRELPND